MQRTERAGETDHRAAQELELPKIVLEITRGRAKHLRREVRTSAFLIGTAPDCDLVLGDPRFDDVHSYLFVSPRRVTIRHLGLGPALCVGGRTVSCVALEDLDTLQMGAYEFRVLIEWPQSAAGSAHAGSRNAEAGASPMDHERAIGRLLRDVEQYSPPRLTLFVGDGQPEGEDGRAKPAPADYSAWRQNPRKAIS
jgi:hypothetical protein